MGEDTDRHDDQGGHDGDERVVAGLEVLDVDECLRLLERTPVGRIVFNGPDGPAAVPVNYRWHEDSVVFRTLDGQKLDAAAMGQQVAFQIDDWDVDSRTGWSVLVKGRAREVVDWAEREQLEQLQLVPWAKGVWRPAWVRIEPGEITGRRLV